MWLSTYVRCCLAFLFLLVLLAPGQMLAEIPDLTQAIKNVVEEGDKASDESKALVFLYNKQINRLAIAGRMPPKDYQACQQVFAKINRELIEQAVARQGMKVRPRPDKRGDKRGEKGDEDANPGTDTDVIVESFWDSSITVERIRAAEEGHQLAIREFLTDKLKDKPDHLPSAGQRIETETDFLPNPDYVQDEKEFLKISEHINRRGGTAYERANAARVESQLRPREGEEIDRLTVSTTGDYVSELQRLARKKIEAADEYERRSRDPRLSDDERIQLVAEAQLARSQAAKYMQRITNVCQVLAEQNDLAGFRPPYFVGRLIREIEEQGRGPQSRYFAGALGVLGPGEIHEWVVGYTEVLARLAARDPDAVEVVIQEIARQIEETMQHASDPAFIEHSMIEAAVDAYRVATGDASAVNFGDADAVKTFEEELRRELHRRRATTAEELDMLSQPPRPAGKPGDGVPDTVVPAPLPTLACMDSICCPGGLRQLTDEEAMERMHDTWARDWSAAGFDPLRWSEVKNFRSRLHQEGFALWDKQPLLRRGYWYGPGWWGGSTLPDRVGPMPPTDSLDAVAMRHDFAYQIAEQYGAAFNSPALEQRIKSMADMQAVVDAASLPDDPQLWKYPPADIEEAKQARAQMVYGFAVISPSRELLGPLLEWDQRLADLSKFGKMTLSFEGIEPILRRYELSKIDEAEKQLTLADLNKMVDNRVFQWFRRYGKTEAASAEFGAGLAYLLEGGGAIITRANPGSLPGALTPGEVIFRHSGSWVRAFGGWRTEPFPLNKPVSVGPLAVHPGRYRAQLEFVPDIFPAMTSANYNTSMSASFWPRAGADRTAGQGVASLSPGAGNKPRGEVSHEFTIRRVGYLRVGFGMAASHGAAGGYVEHEQTYTGKIEYLGPIEQETADICTELMSGDSLRAGANGATLRFADGTLASLSPNGEIAVEATAEGLIRLKLRGGDLRLTREGETPGRIEVELSDGRLIRPQGTDFIITDSGVGVIHGEIDVTGADGKVERLGSSDWLSLRDGQKDKFDTTFVTPNMSVDGIPLRPENWSMAAEPYGFKAPQWSNDSVGDGWLLADREAVWRGPGREPQLRQLVKTPAPGTLRIDVPLGSGLDNNRNNAPRLLHKVTGDFDLEADLRIEGGEQADVSARFIVRAPGSQIGRREGQFSGAMADGPGQSYWLGGVNLGRAADGKIRLPVPYEVDATRWIPAPMETMRVRFSRREGLFLSSWSHDGKQWHAGHFAVLDLPETIWIGWAFNHLPRGNVQESEPASFILNDIGLRTAPGGALPSPDWLFSASAGAAELDDDGVRLTLTGGEQGVARASSGRYLTGDFDVEVEFETDSVAGVPDQTRRWTFSAMTAEEKGLAVGCEVNTQGQRYGIVRHTGPGPSFRTDMTFSLGGTEIVQEPQGRLRLVRADEKLAAYYWLGDEWQLFREIPYAQYHTGGFGGPIFLSFEVSNGERVKEFAPVDVRFTLRRLYAAPSERLIAEAARLESVGDLHGALESYLERQALRPESLIAAEIRRIEAAIANSPPSARLVRRVTPATSADEALPLEFGQPVRAIMLEDGREHWYRVSLPSSGALNADFSGVGILSVQYFLHDGPRVMASSPARLAAGRIRQPDLTAGEYFIRVHRTGGTRGYGPYILEATHDPATSEGDAEPNNTRAQAQEIPVGEETVALLGYGNTTMRDTTDWFAFTIDRPGTVSVEVKAEETLKLELYLQEANGHRYAADNIGHESLRRVEQTGLAPGTYYAFVNHRQGYGAYTIQASLTPVTIDGDTEPNNTRVQAQEIPVGEATAALLGYGNIAMRDTTDWFAFTIDRPGTVSVEVKAEETLKLELYLHEVNGRRIATDNAGNQSERRIEQAELVPGTYCIHVNLRQGYGSYTIMPSLKSPAIDGDEQANKMRDQALAPPTGEAMASKPQLGDPAAEAKQAPGLDKPVAFPTTVANVSSLRDVRPRRVGVAATTADSRVSDAAGVAFIPGVVVQQVLSEGTAKAAGLQAGDLITNLGDFPIETIEDFQARLQMAPPGSSLPMIVSRRRQPVRLNLEASLGDPNAASLESYSFPGGGYQFNRLPGWTLSSKPKQEEVTSRRYDLIESVEKNYTLVLYRDFEFVDDPVEALEAFRLRTSEGFLHGKSGWVSLADIPGVFVAGVVGRERLHTLYRLAFVVRGRLYEINLFTPPKNDPGKLPLVLEATLGSLRPTSAGLPNADAIEWLRQRARQTWSPPEVVPEFDEFQDESPQVEGWSKSELDPSLLVQVFKPLGLKPGFRLRAYIYREDGNANGIVWAMPEAADFPEPKDCPTLEHHLFQAPKPWDALDDFMEAIVGDGSEWSYLAASIIRRELREFGASWHGIEWGTHFILDEDPWLGALPNPEEFDLSRPSNPEPQWKWSEAKPKDWAPTVQVEPNQVVVTYYTYTGKGTQRIIRHSETYRPGSYRARVRDQEIATGGPGYLF
jgi:hypothetical protein